MTTGTDPDRVSRVSVLMTCYNTRAYLPEAVESVLGQTFSDFEFIIINDGSTDDTADYLDQLDDPRITVVHQKNQGLGVPINKHFALCRGEYIARVDSDDWCYPERLEKQVALLDVSPDVVMIGSWMKFFNEHGEMGPAALPVKHEDILKGMLNGLHMMSHPTMMFRRDVIEKIGGYRWRGVGEDWGLQLDAARHGKLGMVAEPLYKMRLHSRSNAWKGAERVYLGFDFAIQRYAQWKSGEEEITEEEFLAQWENAGFLRRMSVRLRAISSTIHRQSMVDRLNGHTVNSKLKLIVAALMYPPKLFGAIWKRLRRR